MLVQDLTPPTPSPPRHQRRPTQALTLVPTSESGTSMAVGRMTHLVSNLCGNHNDDITDVGISMQSRMSISVCLNVAFSHCKNILATMNVLIALVTQS